MYQTYAVTLLEIFMFEMGNSIFQEIVHLFVVSFASEFILFVVVCILFLLCSCLEAPLFTTIFMIVERVFNRNLTCLNQLSNCFSSTIFYSVPSIFLLSESICFGASTYLSPSFFTMENMCFYTTFTQWEGSTRKDGSGISSSSFTWMTS